MERHPARGALQGAVFVASPGPGRGDRGRGPDHQPAPTQAVRFGSAPLSSKGGYPTIGELSLLVEGAGFANRHQGPFDLFPRGADPPRTMMDNRFLMGPESNQESTAPAG